MKISVVIPNWNGEAKLLKHLPQVIKVAEDNKIDEVVVADDASTDQSVEIVRQNFPEVKLITKTKNSGFGSNVNWGVKHAIGDLLVLLNSDAELDGNFLKFALPHFNNPKVFSVGLNSGGCWSWAKFERGFFWHYQAELLKTGEKFHQTLWVSGGSGIFRRTIWDQLGGFDPLYDPFYVEDLDLGYRATKRGFINIWDSRAKAEHYKEKGVIETHFSQQRISETAERNQLIFTWKNITSPKFIHQHQIELGKRLMTNPKYWQIFIKTLFRLPQIMEKRELEKKEAVLTDEQIFAQFNNVSV